MEGHRPKSDPPAYSPIPCALHDRLEALATLGQPCRIVYRDADGSSRETDDRIVDVFARAGEEFVRTAAGLEIRLDRLEWVAGVQFSSGVA
jgi:Rho-binding antiterminator